MINQIILKSVYRLLLCSVVVFSGCGDVDTELKTPEYNTGLPADHLGNLAFKKIFPLHYASYELNNESSIMTVYKGSVPYMKNDNKDPLPEGYKYAQPYLKNLWLGYPFMYDYRESRGHTHAIGDVLDSDRPNRYGFKSDLPATCWNCKTPQMLKWTKEDGNAFWSKDMNEFRERLHPEDDTIGCVNCHNPQTMELQLYSEPLKDYLVSVGKDPDKLSRQEMRSLVCAQCHVEYYFEKTGVPAKPVFPWAKGFNPEDIYQYYKEHGDSTIPGFEGQFYDWIHPVSKTPMIKIQHPEYETWIDGPHGSAGVTCADCHMPYERGKNGQKMSSHYWTSPLKDPEMRACRQCHADKSPEFLKESVVSVQKATFDQLLIAQELSVKAHEAVRLADEYTGQRANNYDQLMIQARDMIRKGQLFWDYVSAENGVGFHNPVKALNTLASSMQYSQEAINLAMEATKYAIGPKLQGDIKEIVPPILVMSRKLQQDPEYLKTNPWFKYLKVLPKAEIEWDGTKYLGDK